MSTIVFRKSDDYDSTDSCTNSSSCKGNRVYTSHKAIYQDVSVVRSLNVAKSPVYLVSSNINNKEYVMKVFDTASDHSQLYFKNESRFASLQHPNVIRSLHCEQGRQAEFDNRKFTVSYIIMEHAKHGDLLEFFGSHREALDEKLARTFFRQLIEGLEYIHKNGIAHMDLKLDNLLLGAKYDLKIADFDLSYFENDALIIGHGTKFYRAPELAKGRCHNPKAADIFSAGIILFTLMTQGVLPQFEDRLVGDVNFADLMNNSPAKFWNKHVQTQNRRPEFFTNEFKDLFMSMTKLNPRDRASIQAIKASKWYNGPIYNQEELAEKMQKLF